MLTQIINAKILTPQGWLKDGSVLMRDDKILEVTNCDLAVIGAELFDAKGMYVVPGGVEIHCHGGGGRDFMEGTEDAFRKAIETHMKHGTTSIFPTLSSSSVEMINRAADTCTRLMAEPNSPVLGLHLEGHYLNQAMAGGQMPEYIKNPDPKEYIPIVEQWKCIKRWDAAPELPGAMQFGKYISGKGILASVAHTQAEYEDIQSAWESGYSHATHFYNAMPGFHKRREYKYEGTVESIYLIDDMTVEVVADGIHVPATILRLVYKIKGVERGFLTLHSGRGNYKEIDVEDLTKHRMDSEEMFVDDELVEMVNKAKDDRKRVCAVGTSVMRGLASAVCMNGHLMTYEGWTNKFIFPPYDFTVCDSMVSNFHLPYSTMLMMVAAFGGYENVMRAYDVAVKEKYSFGAYGDAMLVMK